MKLLFRAPLFLSDIRDPEEIKKHWPEILEAVRLSSTVLFEKIRLKQPEELSPREKTSVYRYLLRGKYRPTPFAKWAGVGIAKWVTSDQEAEAVTALTSTPIRSEEIPEPSREYWLNPSLESWGDGWKFWNFDFENEQWRYSKSANSPLIQELRNLSFGDQPVKKERLFQVLPGLLHKERETIWQHLTDKQLLVSGNFSQPVDYQRKEDRFILENPTLNNQYREQLDIFLKEIGILAVYQENHYLSRLTERFVEEFDDRFVPLKMLWKLVPYLGRDSRDPEGDKPQAAAMPIYKNNTSTLDLRKFNFAPINPPKVNHTQVLFRILKNGQILIDNLVFNRPFVYGGRFTHHPELYDYFKKRSGLLDDVIYADVKLLEGHKARQVSSHRSVTPFSVNCFSGSMEANELDGSETYLGIQNGKFILMVPEWGKQVIPLFQHPLNPHFITHPICRILWEVAHQEFLRPIYYSGRQFVDADYLPQLQWGDIILQPRQWKINRDTNYRNADDLIGNLTSLGVPNKILVGFQDQELALDLECKQDREILYGEVRKQKAIHIQEWLWDSGNHQPGNPGFYPQFLWGNANPGTSGEPAPGQIVNYISDFENTAWFSASVRLSPDFQESIITHQIRLFFDGLEHESIRPYYYLFYKLKSMEIRLRCQVANQTQKDKVTTLLHGIIKNITDIDHIKITPYYPEYAKYSKSAMTVSEELFYQETKMILQLNPRSKTEKIMLAVGIGSIYLEHDPDEEFWIAFFKELTLGKIFHQSFKPYIKLFQKSTSKEWRVYFSSLVSRHHWAKDPKKKGMFIGNHIHMLINRIFWEEGVSVEPEIFSLLSSILREKKYGYTKSG